MSNRIFWVLLTLVVLALHATRAWSFLAVPEFYGEEGKIFFLENHDFGAAAILKTYAGYLHLFPRLVAFASTVLTLWKIPLYFHLASLMAHALLLYSVARFSEKRPRAIQVLLALMTIALPHGGEVFLNLPNTISFLAPVPLFLFLAPRATGVRRIFDAILMALAALSGPYSLIWLPILAVVAFWRRRGDRLLLAILAAGALAQFAVLRMGVRDSVPLELTWNSSFRMITAFWGPLFFAWLPRAPSVDQTTVLLLVGGGLLWLRLRKRKLTVPIEAWILLVSGLALWAAAIKGSLGDFSWMHPLGGGMRYFWTPYVLIGAALTLFFAARPKILASVCGLIFLSAMLTWFSPKVMEPGNHLACPQDGGPVEVEVHPPAWNFTLTLKDADDARKTCGVLR